MIDSEAVAVLKEWELRSPSPVEELPVEVSRASGLVDERITGSGPDLEDVRDRRYVSGEVTVNVREYTKDAAHRPVIIYAHGGGWTLLTIDASDRVCRELAARTPFNVVSVDYRRAPEDPYPAALDDVWAVCEEVAAGALGYKPPGILVAGDSAGGNLAAAACLRGRRVAPGLIAGQVLLYPALGRDYRTESYRAFASGYRLTASAMRWFWDNYAGDEMGDEECVPLSASTMAGLPPAVILTAGYDPLRDDGRSYAARLAEAGVDVQYVECATLPHGIFMMLERVAEARRALDTLCTRVSAMAEHAGL